MTATAIGYDMGARSFSMVIQHEGCRDMHSPLRHTKGARGGAFLSLSTSAVPGCVVELPRVSARQAAPEAAVAATEPCKRRSTARNCQTAVNLSPVCNRGAEQIVASFEQTPQTIRSTPHPDRYRRPSTCPRCR